MKSLLKITGETAIRFAIPRLALSDDGTLYVSSSIYPSPQSRLVFFSFVGRSLLLGTGTTYLTNVPTLETCARNCFNKFNSCLSFDYAASTKVCWLNLKHYLNGSLSQSSIYEHYSRNALYAVKYSENYVLWENLFNQTNSKQLSLSVTIKDKNFDFTAISIDKTQLDRNVFGSSKFNLII